ncbi:MAG: tetratricopeptide repeat protein [Bacteroidota bacterium]
MSTKAFHEEEGIEKGLRILQTHQNKILVGISTIILLIAGWYGYNEYVKKPNEEKAADALFKSQGYFTLDSSRLVLNGDGQSKGVLYVMRTFSGTKAANLAKFYAGISYLHLGEHANAVKYLEDFSTDAPQIQLLAYGNLGDAYAELNKKDQAVTAYLKAAHHFEKDDSNSAEYLFRAALLSETMGKTSEALELYKELKEKYPKTEKGYQADKYINRLSVQKD